MAPGEAGSPKDWGKHVVLEVGGLPGAENTA